jgi:hypothetical protein
VLGGEDVLLMLDALRLLKRRDEILDRVVEIVGASII